MSWEGSSGLECSRRVTSDLHFKMTFLQVVVCRGAIAEAGDQGGATAMTQVGDSRT